MLILAYDTETTGFPNGGTLEGQPHIVQLSYILVMLKDGVIEEVDRGDFIVNPGVPIPPETTKFHGITDEMVAGKKTFREIARPFMEYALTCDYLVGHNIEFDNKMLSIEMDRAYNDKDLKQTHWNHISNKSLCTMKESTDLLQIKGANGRLKYPKLMELHEFLFQEQFDGAHNSMNDVVATLRCFSELLNMGIFPDLKK